MVVFPNAKINIGLNILRRRPDSYHDIISAIVPIPWCDVLEIVPAKGTATTLHTSGRRVDCPPEKNLVMKAYRSLSEVAPLPPVDIYLCKIIPDGAGLGGGSADAAFTLTALNDMFALDLPLDTLARIAASIGADCPFFIYNKPMLATGTGTTLSPLPELSLSGLTIAVIKPQAHVSTAMAYASVTPHIPSTPLTQLLPLPIGRWRGNIVNDFEPGISAIHPVIAEIKQWLYDAGALYASMSGSGSALFGIFDNDILADTLRDAWSDCDIFCARI